MMEKEVSPLLGNVIDLVRRVDSVSERTESLLVAYGKQVFLRPLDYLYNVSAKNYSVHDFFCLCDSVCWTVYSIADGCSIDVFCFGLPIGETGDKSKDRLM